MDRNMDRRDRNELHESSSFRRWREHWGMRKRRMRARREHGQSLACLGGTWEMEMMRKQPVDATDERLCETTKPDNSLHISINAVLLALCSVFELGSMRPSLRVIWKSFWHLSACESCNVAVGFHDRPFDVMDRFDHSACRPR